MKPDRHKAKKMDNDDKIPTLDMQQAKQLRPFMSTRQRVGRQRNRGSILGQGQDIYLFSKGTDRFWNLLSLSTGTGDAFLHLQRPGIETEYSSSSSVTVKNERSNTYVPPYALMGSTEPELPFNLLTL